MTPNEICAAIIIGIGIAAIAFVIYWHFNAEDLYQKGIDTMNRVTVQYRADQLKQMHNLIGHANDESIYDTWIILGIPDEPQEEDFYSVAENDEDYNTICDLFIKLISNPGFRV